MKVLELFSGQGRISAAFKKRGNETFKVDWSDSLDTDLCADVSKLTVDDVIKLCGGVPDVIWASPDCTTYSIATHRHRTLEGGLKPKTDYAAECDTTNENMWNLIDRLVGLGTKYYFVENPRGRMRHMPFVSGRKRYTITYCSYGARGGAKGHTETFTMKPTDIWTNHPSPGFIEVCSARNPPHRHGAFDTARKRDYLSRGEMPSALVEHIASL